MQQENKYQVVVSEQAMKMLVSHAAFLAQVSPQAAERLTVAFEKTAHALEQMPQRCPWFRAAHIPPNLYRSILFEKHYLILFQIKEGVVYADYVLDCRRDYRWLL